MSTIHENFESQRGMRLATKLALLAGAFGVLMTATFTVLAAKQMRAETTANYHHMLEAIVQVRESLLLQQYSQVKEMVPLIAEAQTSYAQSSPPPMSKADVAAQWKAFCTGAEPDHVTSGRFAADQDAADNFVETEGRGAQQVHRLLEGNPGELPLGTRLVFLDKRSVVLAPAEWRTQELPVPMPAGHLAQASISRRAHVWHGERGSYLYRVFYFAPQEWYVACFMPLASLEEVLARRLRQMQCMGLVITLLGVVLAYWFGGRLTVPLRALDRAVRVLPTLDLRADILLESAEDHVPAFQRGVCSASPAVSPLPPLPLTRNDEVGALARSFDGMVRQLHENVRQMLALGQEQARMQGDLQWARLIQDNMLRREFPNNPMLDVHGCVLPAREGGGDFYDAFMLDDNHCCFTVGTVRDKGVSAAVAMSKILGLTRSLVRQSAPALPPVGAVLTQVNAAVCRDTSCTMFATMILGVLHCGTGVLTWANAGHASPLRLCPTDMLGGDVPRTHAWKLTRKERMCARVEALPTRDDMLLGGFVATEYGTHTCALVPGDRVVLYTEGAPEALREDGERFGAPPAYWEGLPPSASALNWHIVKEIQMFVAGAPQDSDITLLNFLWRGPQE